MRLLPRSLFGQVLLALLLGLLIAQGAALWLALGERARVADRLGGRIAAQRIGAVIELMEPVEPFVRLDSLRARHTGARPRPDDRARDRPCARRRRRHCRAHRRRHCVIVSLPRRVEQLVEALHEPCAARLRCRPASRAP